MSNLPEILRNNRVEKWRSEIATLIITLIITMRPMLRPAAIGDH